MSVTVASMAIQEYNKILSVPELGFFNDVHAAKYFCIACAASFQIIVDLLSTIGANTITFDSSADIYVTSSSMLGFIHSVCKNSQLTCD